MTSPKKSLQDSSTVIDFVHQYEGHKLEFECGTSQAARFNGESELVRFKDCVLLRNRSGKVGIWHLYSVIRNYQKPGHFKAVGRLIGYQNDYDVSRKQGVRSMEDVFAFGKGTTIEGTGGDAPRTRVLGLLGEGSGS